MAQKFPNHGSGCAPYAFSGGQNPVKNAILPTLWGKVKRSNKQQKFQCLHSSNLCMQSNVQEWELLLISIFFLAHWEFQNFNCGLNWFSRALMPQLPGTVHTKFLNGSSVLNKPRRYRSVQFVYLDSNNVHCCQTHPETAIFSLGTQCEFTQHRRYGADFYQKWYQVLLNLLQECSGTFEQPFGVARRLKAACTDCWSLKTVLDIRADQQVFNDLQKETFSEVSLVKNVQILGHLSSQMRWEFGRIVVFASAQLCWRNFYRVWTFFPGWVYGDHCQVKLTVRFLNGCEPALKKTHAQGVVNRESLHGKSAVVQTWNVRPAGFFLWQLPGWSCQ